MNLPCPNPACNASFSVGEDLTGKRVLCKNCKTVFEVPIAPQPNSKFNRSRGNDVFISYNRKDRESAVRIVEFLLDQGLTVFFDETHLRPGSNWLRGLETAIAECRSVTVIMGPLGLGQIQQVEKDLALNRHFTEPNFPVVPVRLPDNNDPPSGFLALDTWIDLRTNVSDPAALASLKEALLGQYPDNDSNNAARGDVCPYRGLLPFREEDRDFYFGRESDVAELVRLVDQENHAVIPVIGSSGSGKSSLVYAGLIPALRNPMERDERIPWQIVTLRPYAEPLQSLMEALSPPAEDMTCAARIASLNESANFLRQGKILVSQIVEDALKRSGGCQRMLIFVDQWEELYSQIPRDKPLKQTEKATSDRILFIDSLLEAAKLPNCTLVFTVRADFYEPLLGWDNQLTHGKLQDHLNRAALSLGPMDRDALHDSIVKPATKAGYHFADGLVEVILDDVGLQPGQLPLLEFFLRELWGQREGNEFTFQGNRDSGGVSGAIARRADQELAKLFKQKGKGLEEAARRVFVSLVNPEEGREDTRAVIDLPKSGPEREVIEWFSGQTVRLLTAGSGKVEVSHEALIRQWRQLQDEWLQKNRDFLRVRNRIRASRDIWAPPKAKDPSSNISAADNHNKTFNCRNKDLLIPRGRLLEDARDLCKNHGDVIIDDIKDYIHQSLKQNFWQNFRRWVILIVVSGIAIFVGYGGFLFWGIGFSKLTGEEKALEEFHREIYDQEFESPTVPAPLENPSQASRPFHFFKNPVGMNMIWCWPGNFKMGSPSDEPGRYSDEKQHDVSINSGFWMSETEVTQAQWLRVMEANPSLMRLSDEMPVSGVSWEGAMTFCESLTKLAKKTGTLPVGWKYTLPTEAQWEYACRAGTTAPFGTIELNQGGWYIKNALFYNHPVGRKKPNQWGFYDMHGNVYEWCLDFYDKEYFLKNLNLSDHRTKRKRVARGGDALSAAGDCRSAFRGSRLPAYRKDASPDNRSDSDGFRPVLVIIENK